MAVKRGALMRTTFAVTLVIVVSKLIGFIREMIMANYFGSNAVTDAYNSAYSLFYLPVLLFSSCVTSTLVPMYVRREHKLGRDAANRFASNSLNLFLTFAMIVSVVMIALASPIVRVVYNGFDAETVRLTVELSRIMYPALAFFVGAVVLATVLNAQEHYIAAQLTGFPLSAALIFTAVTFSGGEGYSGIRAQAWGVLAAGVLQIAILLPSLKKDFRYSFRFNINDPGFRRLIALAVPAVLSMAVGELNHMIDRMLASTLESGDISAMSYAFKLIMFMMGVMVVPLTTVTFSRMAKKLTKRDAKALRPYVRRSVESLMLIVLPVVAIAAVASVPIIRLAYGRGRFTDANVIKTAGVFMFYVVGVPFFGLRDLLNRVFHSFQDTKTPMRVACMAMTINILLNLALRRLMGVNGLAFATSIAALVSVLTLLIKLRARIPRLLGGRCLREILKIAFATLLCLMTAILTLNILPDARGSLNVFACLCAIAGAALTVYMLSCYLLGIRQFGKFLGALKKRA